MMDSYAFKPLAMSEQNKKRYHCAMIDFLDLGIKILTLNLKMQWICST